MNKITLFRRILSSFLCLCLLDPSGLTQTLAVESPREDKIPSYEDLLRLSPWVNIQEYSEPATSDGKFLLVLRDLHGDQDAQLNIAGIIEAISHESRVTSHRPQEEIDFSRHETGDRRQATLLVFAEGASGKVDTSFFGTFPDKTIRRELTRDFVGKGWLTGPEYLSIASFGEIPLEIWGVEDLEIYRENFRVFREVLLKQEETRDWFEAVHEVVRKLKKKFYHPQLFALDEMMIKRRSGLMDYEEYATYLLEKFGNSKIKFQNNLGLYFKILEKKKALDEKTLAKEREALHQKLGEALQEEALSRLIRKSLEFRLGKIRSADYFEYLAGEAWKAGIDLGKDFPTLLMAMDLFKLEAEIDVSRLIEELDRVEGELRVSWLETPQEQAVDLLWHEIEVLEKMCRLEVNREDLSFYESAPEKFYFERLIERLGAIAGDAGFKLPSILGASSTFELFEPILQGSTHFYKMARLRDKVMVECAIERMKSQGQGQAILIAGGFHTQGITALLKARGWGYAVGIPRVNHVPDEEVYLSHMMDERFETHVLAIPSLFSAMIDELGRLVKEKEWEALARAYVRALADSLETQHRQDSTGVLARELELWIQRQRVLNPLMVKLFSLLKDEVRKERPLSREEVLKRPDIERFIRLSQVHAELTLQILERFYPNRKEDIAFAKAKYKEFYLEKKPAPHRKAILHAGIGFLAIASLGASVACDVAAVLAVDPFVPSLIDGLPTTVSKTPSHVHFVNGDPRKPLYVFDDHNGGNYKLTPEELKFIYRMVDGLAPTGSRIPQWVATAKYTDPFYGLSYAAALATPQGGISFATFPNPSSPQDTLALREGDNHFLFTHGEYFAPRESRQVMVTAATQWNQFPRMMLHEMGHQVHYGWSSEETDEWVTIHKKALNDKRPGALDRNFSRAYARKNWREGAASTLEDFVETPAYLGTLIHRAEQGFPAHLQMALFMLSFLTVTRPEGQYVNFYDFKLESDGTTSTRSIPVLDFVPLRIFRTKDALVLPGVKFGLEKRGDEVVLTSAEYIGEEVTKNASGSVFVNQKHFKNNFPQPVVLPRTFLRKVPETSEFLIPEAIRNPTSSWATPAVTLPATPTVIDIVPPSATPDVTVRIGILGTPTGGEMPYPGLLAMGLLGGWGRRRGEGDSSKGRSLLGFFEASQEHRSAFLLCMLSLLFVGGCRFIPYNFFVPPLQASREHSFVDQLPDGVSGVPSYVYHPNGKMDQSVYIFDAHTGQDLKFTPEETQVIFRVMDSWERARLKLPKWLATARIDDRIYGLGRGGAYSVGEGLVFPAYSNERGGPPSFVMPPAGSKAPYRVMVTAATAWRVFPTILFRELGRHMYGALSEEDSREWGELFDRGANTPEGAAQDLSFVGGQSRDVTRDEEFAIAMSFVANTEAFLYEALRRAEEGHPLVLEKALFTLSRLVREESGRSLVDFFEYDNPFDGGVVENPRLIISPSHMARTSNALTLSGFEFSLEDRDGKTVIVAVKALDKFKGTTLVERNFRDRPIEVPQALLRKVPPPPDEKPYSGLGVVPPIGGMIRRKPKSQEDVAAPAGIIPLRRVKELAIEHALRVFSGNAVKASQALGIDPHAVRSQLRKMESLGYEELGSAGFSDSSEIIPWRELRKQKIDEALAVVDGNVTLAAERLGMSRMAIYRRFEEVSQRGRVAPSGVIPLAEAQWQAVEKAMVAAGGFTQRAARLLGLSGMTVQKILAQHGKKTSDHSGVRLSDDEARTLITPWRKERRERILEALQKAAGNISLAAAWLGINKLTVKKELQSWPADEVLAMLYHQVPQNRQALKFAQALLIEGGNPFKAMERSGMTPQGVMETFSQWNGSFSGEDRLPHMEELRKLHTGVRGAEKRRHDFVVDLYEGMSSLGKALGEGRRVRIYPDPLDEDSVVGQMIFNGEVVLSLKSRKDGGVEPYALQEPELQEMIQRGYDWDWIEERFDPEKIGQVVSKRNGLERVLDLKRMYESYLTQLSIVPAEELGLRDNLVKAVFHGVMRNSAPDEVVSLYLDALKLRGGDLDFSLRKRLIIASNLVIYHRKINSLKKTISLFKEFMGGGILPESRRDWVLATYEVAVREGAPEVLEKILQRLGALLKPHVGDARLLGNILVSLAFLSWLPGSEVEEEVEELESYLEASPDTKELVLYFKAYRTEVNDRAIRPASSSVISNKALNQMVQGEERNLKDKIPPPDQVRGRDDKLKAPRDDIGFRNQLNGFLSFITVLGLWAVAGCHMPPVPIIPFIEEESGTAQIEEGVPKIPSHVYFINGKKDKPVYFFDDHLNKDLKFTPSELAIIYRLLDLVEPLNLRLPKWFATVPEGIYDKAAGVASRKGGGGVVLVAKPNVSPVASFSVAALPFERFRFHGDESMVAGLQLMASTFGWQFPGGVLHEIGHHFRFGLEGELRDEWLSLYDEGKKDKRPGAQSFNFVNGQTVNTPSATEDYEPYGSKNENEAFGSLMGNMIQTEGLLREAVDRAAAGYPHLLRSVLFILPLLTMGPSDNQTINFLSYWVDKTAPNIRVNPVKIVRTEKLLTLSEVQFSLAEKDGKVSIVSVQFRDRYKKERPIVRKDFPIPVELPQALLRTVPVSGSRIALASGPLVRDDKLKALRDETRLPRKPKWDRGTGFRVSQRIRKAHDGFIKSKEGQEAEEEFERQKPKIQQFEIKGAYEKPLQKALERLLDLGELSGREKGLVMAISERLKRKELRFLGFQGIVKGREDFFLGHFDEEENRVYLAIDLIHRLGGVSSTLVQEYLLHEILCPILGHERAILVQQKIFPEHYPDKGQLREQTDARPYKGLLGAALRRFINKEARKEYHPRQTIEPPPGVIPLRDLERGAAEGREEMVLAALQAAGGNPTLAAQWLGIDKRETLYRKLSTLPPRIALALLYQNPPQNSSALKLAQALLMTRGDLVRAAEMLKISLDAVMSILGHWSSRRDEDAIEAEEKRLLELHTGRRGISTGPTHYGYALFNGLVQLGKIYEGEFKVRIYPDPIDGESVIGVLRVGRERLLTLKSRKDGGVEPYHSPEDAWKDMALNGGIDWDWLEEKFDLKKIDQILKVGDGFEKLRALRRIYESYLDQLGITQEEEKELRKRLVVASAEHIKRHRTPSEVIDIYLGELKLKKGDLNFKLKRQLITASYSVVEKGDIASLRRTINYLRALTDDRVTAFARRDWITATYMIAKMRRDGVLEDILSKLGDAMAYYRGQAEVLGDMLGCLAYLTLLPVEEREEEVEELISYFQEAPTQQEAAYYFKLYRTDLAYRVMHPQRGGDGFIAKGPRSRAEFERQKPEIQKSDVSEKYWGRSIDLLTRALRETELTDAERGKLFATLQDFREGKIKIHGFKGIVRGEKDFFLGHFDISDKEKNHLHLATDLIESLEAGGQPTQGDEYIVHEILCPLLGHKRAIRVQQEVFPQHYPDRKKLHKQTPENPYKGVLKDGIRSYIDWEAVKILEATPRRFFEEIHTSTPWPILWRGASAGVWQGFMGHLPIKFGRMVEGSRILRKFGIRRTPLVVFPKISETLGMKVMVKDEGQQVTGSFKPRILSSFFEPLRHWWGRLSFALHVQVITTGTTGNQGQGIAWAAKYLRERFPVLLGWLAGLMQGWQLWRGWEKLRDIGLSAKVFMTADTPKFKEERIREWGAEVVKVEGHYGEARRLAEAEGVKPGVLYLRHAGPEAVMSYGSLGLEILEDLVDQWKTRGRLPPHFDLYKLFRLKAKSEAGKISRREKHRLTMMMRHLKRLERVAVLVPIGAGGVASGVFAALKFLNPRVIVIGVSTDQTSSMYESLAAGELKKMEIQQNVYEDGINVDTPEPFAFEVFENLADGVVVVPHERIGEGIRAHQREAQLKSEGAAVLPYLALTEYPELVEKLKARGVEEVVLVSTGGNIDPEVWRRIVAGLEGSVKTSDASRSQLSLPKVSESPMAQTPRPQQRRGEVVGAVPLGFGPKMSKDLFTLPGTPEQANVIDLWYEALHAVLGDQPFLIHPKPSLTSMRVLGAMIWRLIDRAEFVICLPEGMTPQDPWIAHLEGAFQEVARRAGITVQTGLGDSHNGGVMRLRTPDGMEVLMDYTLVPFDQVMDPSQANLARGGFNLLGTYFGHALAREWGSHLAVEWPRFQLVLSHFLELVGDLNDLYQELYQSFAQLKAAGDGRTQRYRDLIIQSALLRIYRPMIELAYMLGEEEIHTRLLRQLGQYLRDEALDQDKILNDIRGDVAFFADYSARKAAQRMVGHFQLLGKNSEFDEVAGRNIFEPENTQAQDLLRMMRRFPFAAWLFWQELLGATPWWLRGLRPNVRRAIHPAIREIYLAEKYRTLPYENVYNYPILAVEGDLSHWDKALLFGYMLNLEPLADGTFVALGRYVFEDLIGVGSYGFVFKVRDLHADRSLALKLIHHDRPVEKAVVDTLFKLGRQGITNPHIVEILKTGEARGKDGLRRFYIVTELLEYWETVHYQGERGRIEEYPYDALTHLQTLLQSLEAVTYLLRHGILLFDPKVAMTGGGESFRSVLFDFGYAEQVDFSIADLNRVSKALQDRSTVFRKFQQEWVYLFLLVMELVNLKLQDQEAVIPTDVITGMIDELDRMSSEWRPQERALLEPLAHIMRVALFYLKGDMPGARRYLQAFENGPIYQQQSSRHKVNFYIPFPALKILRREITARRGRAPAELSQTSSGGETALVVAEDEWASFLKTHFGEQVRAIDLGSADGAFKDHLAVQLMRMGKLPDIRALGLDRGDEKVLSIPVEMVISEFGRGSFDLVTMNGFQGGGLFSPDEATRAIVERQLRVAKLLARPGGYVVVTLAQGHETKEIVAAVTRLLKEPMESVTYAPVLDLYEKPESYAPLPFAGYLGRLLVVERKIVNFKERKWEPLQVATYVVKGLEHPRLLSHAALIQNIGDAMRGLFPDLWMDVNDAFRRQVIYQIVNLLPPPGAEVAAFSTDFLGRFEARLKGKGVPEMIARALGRVQTSPVFLVILDQLVQNLKLAEDPEIQLLLLEVYTRIYVMQYFTDQEAQRLEEALQNVQGVDFEDLKKKFQSRFGQPFSVREALVQYVKAVFMRTGDLDFFGELNSMYFEEPFLSQDFGGLFVERWEADQTSGRLHEIARNLLGRTTPEKSPLEEDLEKELLRVLPRPAVAKSITVTEVREKRNLDVAA